MTGKRIRLALLLICSIAFSTCNKPKSSGILVKEGYIVFDDPEFWHFVPVDDIHPKDCYNDVESSKLGKGFQFNPSAIKNLSYIQRTLDTVVSDRQAKKKITPVEIEFEFNPKYLDLFQSTSTDPRWNFEYKTSLKGKPFKFTYNIFPIAIKNVRPLFCLTKREADIKKCTCEHKKNDTNDYAFKACNYVLKSDPYSLLCGYDVKSISTDTLNGQLVTKVELTCCGLGDVAYFDANTKNIISISYGAR